jgi:hypothetical protein
MRHARPVTTTMLLAALGLLAPACRLAAVQVREVDLKAAYIYNFAIFTTWPPDAALQKAPFVVCASAEGPLWPGLQALNGRPVNGRPWTTAELAHPKGGRCDIAVLPPDAERPAPQPPGTLVVRNGAGNGAVNGAASITLVDDDEHIRFDIDTQEAARNGLRFSSRLLRLARNVQ